MKKQLLCTSAIALGVAAAPAAAQDWDLDWGGFMNTHVAIGSVSGSSPAIAGVSFEDEGINILQTGEIIFTPSITLDNGMTFGINVQLEASNSGGPRVDETYMTISSDTFGQLDIGAENSAGYKLMTSAPSVTSMFINSPSISAFIPFSAASLNTGAGNPFGFRRAALSAFTEVAGNNDVNRITYYTPDFNGLTIGVSYAPTGALNAQNAAFAVNKNTVVSDIFDIGVNYSGSFGTTDITLAARYGTANAPSIIPAVAASAGPDGLDGTADDVAAAPAAANPNSDPSTWGLGASATFGAITVGAHYSHNDTGVAGSVGDENGWSLGVVYDAAGPWAFEALTYQGEVENFYGAGLDAERMSYKIGASRDLGPGVDWDIYVVYEERDNESTAGTDVKGTVLGTAINLSF